MLNNNNLNLNEMLTNERGNFEFTVGNHRYEVRRSATEGEIIIYGAAGAILICALAPAYIPATIAWTGLLGSLYGIACVVKSSKGGK